MGVSFRGFDFLNNGLKRNVRILSIVQFLSIFIAQMIIFLTPPSNGYEPSIYSSLPIVFWIFLCFGLFLSAAIISFSALERSNYWILGSIGLILIYTDLYFLPTIRGYEFFGRYNYDIWDHMTSVEYILKNGYIRDNLFYPMTHIFFVITSLIGIKINEGINLFSEIFWLANVSAFFLLGQSFFRNDRFKPVIFFLIASPILLSIFQTAFIPFVYGLSLIPLILYCIHRITDLKEKTGMKILILLLTFTLVFYHPLVAIYLIFFLLVIKFIQLIQNANLIDQINLANIDLILIFLSVSFSVWFFNFFNFLTSVKLIIQNILETGSRTSIVSNQMSIFESHDLILVIIRFLKLYFPIFIYLSVALIGIYVILKFLWKREFGFHKLYVIEFLIAILFTLIFISVYFIILEPLRALSYALIMATIVIGLLIAIGIEKYYFSKIKIYSFLIFLITIVSIFGVFNMYDSPWIGTPSPSISKMELYGMNHFFNNFDGKYPLKINDERLKNYFYYFSMQKEGLTNNQQKFDESFIPSHFGYNNNQTLSKTLNNQHSYLIFRQRDIAFLSVIENKLKTKYPVFSAHDITRLNEDYSVNKIYSNNEFNIFKT